ncbi:ATP-binding cassette domain-containing protein [Agromyces cerinus]|uniref:Energy-coupling factor transport system ATP-binding protein n=1 Tax=Agromyces cerinus subsp. cerinus TaxID=232089 RepID=A0A1N6E7A4_9MICO|nr:ATP-binding cassette domain-containing protein [Agromyces cerinus]SIN78892.1 energy-coupling factor transport system ATP-binding protein [Agromyces cerinus subsp. cerinus]
MRYRAAPLRAAAIVAAVFVVSRVAYRMVFGGAAGGGVLLLDVPRVPLEGPFAHIALFGPITSGGIWNAAVSALPFAAVILAFGVLNALIDVQRLFVLGATRGPIRAVSRALVIAWATAPALAQSVRRMRRAAALRGERGPAALLVPVFEHTVERALALAASMEVRGFAASARPTADVERPVRCAAASLDQGGAWRLDDVDFELAPGSLTIVSGATGSGKSSLLDAMSGLFQHFEGGRQDGSMEIGGLDRRRFPPRETAGFVGVVAQQVRLSFVAETVHDEIGFALTTQGVDAAHIDERVRQTADDLGIARLLDRQVTALSAGEATLVAIAAALVSRPALLLVDEPLAELDTAARELVCEVLDRVAHESGTCVVVAEHRTAEWQRIADTWLEIDGGRVTIGDAPMLPPTPASTSASTAAGDDRAVTERSHPLVSVQGLDARHGDTVAVRDARFTLRAGELVAITGANGAGKSSLLSAMAVPDAPSGITIDGVDVASLDPAARRRAITLVPEQFDDLFFSTTVAAECHRADRRNRPSTPTAQTLAALLGRDLGEGLLLRHPRDLSAGERLCLAIAIQLAPSPAALLVDEPARGLDASARRLVGDALVTVARDGRVVLFATHDREFAARFASRELTIVRGAVAPAPRTTAEVIA